MLTPDAPDAPDGNSNKERKTPLAERDGQRDVESGGESMTSSSPTCIVCMEASAEDDTRLVCVHSTVTFCRVCITSCIRHGRFACPLCNKQFNLDFDAGLGREQQQQHQQQQQQQRLGQQQRHHEAAPPRRMSLFVTYVRFFSMAMMMVALFDFSVALFRILFKLIEASTM